MALGMVAPTFEAVVSWWWCCLWSVCVDYDNFSCLPTVSVNRSEDEISI